MTVFGRKILFLQAYAESYHPNNQLILNYLYLQRPKDKQIVPELWTSFCNHFIRTMNRNMQVLYQNNGPKDTNVIRAVLLAKRCKYRHAHY